MILQARLAASQQADEANLPTQPPLPRGGWVLFPGAEREPDANRKTHTSPGKCLAATAGFAAFRRFDTHPRADAGLILCGGDW